jgi:chromosomal replication initiation ATPase DnaA
MQSEVPEQLALPLPHATARGVEDFLVAPSNRRAVDWIERWPEWPFTALILVGPPESGKTHLAGLWRARSEGRSIDLRASGIEQAMRLAEAGRPVLVDDCDRALADDAASERNLLQLYNILRAANGHCLLTARSAPATWGLTLPDLASRLNGAMLVTIDPPDDALLAGVALKLFADRQLRVNNRVISVLLTHGERSFRGIGRAVEALDRVSLAGRREITELLARQVLSRSGEDLD